MWVIAKRKVAGLKGQFNYLGNDGRWESRERRLR